MAKLEIKYRTEGKALPPRPIRVSLPGWGGSPALKKEDGSEPQPWHCPLHVEGCTHGIELLYQYETECHILNTDGDVQIQWDRAREGLTGPSEFTLSVPRPSQNYLFGTSVDLQAPPGYVLRTEPHPRFFSDTTGTVPAALYGHVQSEWWPKKLFIVFKIPDPGQRHIFRKGEPYVQVLFIPDDDYELKQMSPQEAERRRKLEDAIRISKSLVAKNVWHSAGGMEFNDHYKVLSRAFERDGVVGVETLVRQAIERYEACVPKGKTIPEYFEIARQYHAQGKFTESKEVLHHIMRMDPRNAEVYSRIGVLEWDIGVPEDAERSMRREVALQPGWPQFHNYLGEMLRRLGRYDEAEATFLTSLSLQPNDPDVLSILGLTMAQRGMVAEGLERCRNATAIGPAAPAPHFRMGLILAQLGRQAEARACYETALALNPQFAPARQALQQLQAETPRQAGNGTSGA